VRFLEALALASGMTTVAAVSPHLVDMRERIRVDGRPMTAEQGTAFLTPALDWAESTGTALTYFDLMTIATFQAAHDTHADCMVLEVGLGGRLDSTNVVDPSACVITLLELEHTEFLGDTIEKIAAEKGGIIKPGRPCVVAPQPRPQTQGVLRGIADGVSAPLWWHGDEWNTVLTAGLNLSVERKAPPGAYDRGPITSGAALHAAAEATGIAAWRAATGAWPEDEVVRAANARVRYPACVELIQRDGAPPIIVDAAHTAESAALLARFAPGLLRRRIERADVAPDTLGLIFGCMTDKHVDAILLALKPALEPFARVVLVPRPPQSPRTLPAAAIAEAAARVWPTIAFETVMLPDRDAPLTPAVAASIAPGAAWIVTGSLYLAGEIRQQWLDGVVDEGI
jgi:dihydrofolate synthase/folylpolyglutamate synthase